MNWLDLLTAIGALLGSFAFFQNVFSGIATTNKTKWAALSPDIITENQLAGAINELQSAQQVTERTRTSLLHLNNKLREHGDGFKFKTLLGKPYEKHYAVPFKVTETMRSRFTNPIWKRVPFPDGVGAIFVLDGEYFLAKYGTANAEGEKEKVRTALQHDLEQCLQALTAVRVLANRDDIEYLLPWRLSAK